MGQPLRIDRTDATVVLTLDRPETRNPISDIDMIEQLEIAVADINDDRSVRAVILTGAGTAFCSGGNVKQMRARQGMFGGGPAELRQNYRHGIQRIPRALWGCEVPIIGAVNGPAIGAGCDLALLCDLRIASSTAIFAESFIKLGIIAGDGGAWLLPRAIGLARACEMAYTGDAVDAETALAWGMVSQVVAPADLLDAAHTLAARISTNPGHALRMTKKLLREGQQQSLDSLLELSSAMQAIAHHTDDHDEAVAAMVERRSPRFERG